MTWITDEYLHNRKSECLQKRNNNIILHACNHRRQSWEAATSRFWDGGRVGSKGLHEILLYSIVYRNMRWEHFPKWWPFGNRKICVNKNFADDTLNYVLRASVCWNFRTYELPVFKPGLTGPHFSNQIDWRLCLQLIVARKDFLTLVLSVIIDYSLWRF